MPTQFCTNCGKPLVAGTNECGYCNTALTEDQRELLKEKKEDVVWNNVNKWVLGIWVIMVIGSLPLGIIGALVGYVWTGPECVKAALKYGRSPNWAFFCGGFFNLVGWFVYWCYLKLRGDL